MFSPDLLYEELTHYAAEHQFLVGYSGGLDSHVLLHALHQLRQTYPFLKLRAVHVNHRQSESAEAWQQHCQNICASMNIELLTRTIDITKIPTNNLEDALRTARYQVIAETLQQNEILLTAHTKTDQAETLLLQLLRGAGPRGLAAMPIKKKFAQSYLFRPLLMFSREQLTAYAKQYNLQWIEDNSNADTRFDRNYLRHQIIPLLKNRWSGLTTNLVRSAQNCAESLRLTDELAASDLSQMNLMETNQLPIADLLTLSPVRQRNLIRYWLKNLGITVPNSRKLQKIQTDLLKARPDANPLVRWGNYEMRRYQQQIYVLPLMEKWDSSVVLNWDLQQSLKLPQNLGSLTINKEIGVGLSVELINNKISQGEIFTVKFRQGGETCYLRGHHHSIKKLFQQWKIPPWLRDQVPLIYNADILIAIPGYYIHEKYRTCDRQLGMLIVWCQRQ